MTIKRYKSFGGVTAVFGADNGEIKWFSIKKNRQEQQICLH
jgi:hypothetical protein